MHAGCCCCCWQVLAAAAAAGCCYWLLHSSSQQQQQKPEAKQQPAASSSQHGHGCCMAAAWACCMGMAAAWACCCFKTGMHGAWHVASAAAAAACMHACVRGRLRDRLCDHWQYLLKAWPRSAGRAGTGGNCTGRDQGFVLKAGSISTGYVFFEMGYVRAGRVQQPSEMLTRARAAAARILLCAQYEIR